MPIQADARQRGTRLMPSTLHGWRWIAWWQRKKYTLIARALFISIAAGCFWACYGLENPTAVVQLVCVALIALIIALA